MVAKKLKLVVVGDSFCGKTCLLMRYTSHTFDVNTTATIFENETKTVSHDGVAYDLQLWDTAGQENFDRLRPLVYPNTSVFLICFSISSKISFANVLSLWAREVRDSCAEVPILLVGNKADLRYNYANERNGWTSSEDGKALAKKIGARGYFECSAKLNSGVQKVFDAAIAAAIGIRSIGPMEAARRRKKTCVML